MNKKLEPGCSFGYHVDRKLDDIARQLDKINGRMWRLVWVLVGISIVATFSRFI